MGMDIYGNAPKNDTGEYFRSSIWTWPGVLDVIAETSVLPDDLVERMAYNDGAEVNKEQSVALADALDAKLDSLPKDAHFINDESHYANTGTATTAKAILDLVATFPEGTDIKVKPSAPDFSVDVEFIRQFASFARNSGGFKVW